MLSDLTWTPGGDISALRRHNLRSVMRVLHAGGRYTITQLARAAGVSRPTTAQAVDDLVAVRWVTVGPAGGDEDRKMGRPAQVFEFRPDAGYVLGADVGGHKIVVLIGDLNGTIVARARCAVDLQMPPAQRLQALADTVEAALRGFAPGRKAITDGAIATVGSVNLSGEVIYCTAIPEWQGTNPASWLAERFGFPVLGANDMNMSALAEHWRGAAQEARDVIYLHVGRRLGAGLLLGGRPHTGHHSVAGQVGLWKGLRWRRSYEDVMLPFFASAEEGFAAAARGDEVALARIEEFAAEICQGISPMVVMLDPDLLVVGGGISAAGELLVGPLRRQLAEETAYPPRVVGSTLGDEAVALGAMRLALDSAEERMFASLTPQVPRH